MFVRIDLKFPRFRADRFTSKWSSERSLGFHPNGWGLGSKGAVLIKLCSKSDPVGGQLRRPSATGCVGSIRMILLVIGTLLVSGCDPNAKVVRAGQSDPEKPVVDNAAAGGASPDPTLKDPSGDLTDLGGGGAAHGQRKEESSGSPTVSKGYTEPKGTEVTGVQPSSAGPPPATNAGAATAGPVGVLRQPVPKANPLPPGRSGARATGQCDTADWGACFRDARAFIASDPQKAITIYLKGCLPGQPKGDGLACKAAALLAEASGDAAGAARYHKAACDKVDFPVMSSCRR
jgi:hypothetical protein